MALDHYVPQVHLKNFYSPKLGSLMYAIRKSDLKSFTPNAQSVCRIEDGSTNSYLRKNRGVEGFLKLIEPKYNVALENLAADNIDADCRDVIGGFVASVLVCSPAGMRIHSGLLKGVVEVTARVLDSQGLFSSPPAELGGESLSELLRSEKVCVEIDPKYPQAIGIALIGSLIRIFGNSEWDVMINPSTIVLSSQVTFLSQSKKPETFVFSIESSHFRQISRLKYVPIDLSTEITPAFPSRAVGTPFER